VQFLIYKQFKQFYDINTMTGGAGDAITSYFSEIMHLIFRQGGIFVILLFCFRLFCILFSVQGLFLRFAAISQRESYPLQLR